LSEILADRFHADDFQLKDILTDSLALVLGVILNIDFVDAVQILKLLLRLQ